MDIFGTGSVVLLWDTVVSVRMGLICFHFFEYWIKFMKYRIGNR